ncbi:hypothetical protein P9112_011414 [Eukaryota sp. TZLM1-RC]
MPLYSRFIEIGRIVLVNFGEYNGKLAVVTDVLDGNRVIVEGVAADSQMVRQPFSLKRVALTDFKVKIPRGIRSSLLRKRLEDAEIEKKFNESSRGKKLAKRVSRAQATDFDRFKVMIAKKTLNQKSNEHFNILKKQAKL